MRAFKFLAAFIPLLLYGGIANAQSSNPFNPDYAWCATQGAVATRKANYWQCLLPGTAGQLLQSNGPNADVGWFTTTGTGTVTSIGVGFAASMPWAIAGGSPVTTSGIISLGVKNQATNSFLAGPVSGGVSFPTFRAIDPLDIPLLNSSSMPALTGDVTSTAGSTVTTLAPGAVKTTNIQTSAVTPSTILNGAVGNIKLANMTANTIKGNITAGTAAPTDNTLTATLDALAGNLQGSVLYRNSSAWTALAPGTTGQFLMTQGAAADPVWNGVSGASGGTVTSVTCNNGLSGGTFTLTGTCGLAAIANNGILSNRSGSSAVPSVNNIADLLNAYFSSTQGNILYRSNTGWSTLAPGTAGQVLTTGGTGANPSWQAGIVPGQLPGTATNDDANAGNVGEYVELANSHALNQGGTYQNMDSMSLTAGDWQVTGNVRITLGTGGATQLNCGLNTTSATAPTNLFDRASMQFTTTPYNTAGDVITLSLPPMRYSLASTTTVYLVCNQIGGSAASTTYYKVAARRAR